MTTITVPQVLLDTGLAAPGWVRLDGDRIGAAGTGVPEGPVDLALTSGTLAPGLVDLQLNGAFGVDLAAADEAGWHTICDRLPTTGVTAFVPTVITAPLDDLAAALRRYRALRPGLDAAGGARTLGLHVEGPFLAATRRGAHRGDLLCDPTPERIDALLDAAQGHMVLHTLAPERANALDAIGRLTAAGVRVSVGHSDATDEVVGAAADAGATFVTHLYNAQRPLGHRDPGVVGAALSDPRFTVGMIVDGFHVAPTAVRVAFAAAAGRVVLVTDAIAALGMPPGTYVLGGQRTEATGDRPPVRADGTLAGSDLRLDAAVANAIAFGIAPVTALEAATRVPADAIGRQDLGRIAPGARADLVWLGDDWQTRATWIDGEVVYHADAVVQHLDAGAPA